MELDQKQIGSLRTVEFSCANNTGAEEIIPKDECEELLVDFNLSDQKVSEIKNVMIGLANGVVGLYLDNFE